MFACGLVIVYSFWLILATCSFWLVKVEIILVIFESMFQAGRWPVTLYPRPLRLVLIFIVPVAFAVTVPAQALTPGGSRPRCIWRRWGWPPFLGSFVGGSGCSGCDTIPALRPDRVDFAAFGRRTLGSGR